MKLIKLKPAVSLRGSLSLPGDKSICHRAVILSCLSHQKTIINNFSLSQDCLVTIKAFKELGVKINKKGLVLIIYGKGLYGLRPTSKPLYMGESGTSMRLITGVLAGQPFDSKLNAAASLNKRPMGRMTQPLRLMGANIESRFNNSKEEEYPPLKICGSKLKGAEYRLSIPSAQVKSAILLAGLYAQGKTQIIEPIKSRDHTERMLKLFKAKLKITKANLIIEPSNLYSPGLIQIPADISSAAFFIVGACIMKNSEINIKSVSINPTRVGLVNVLKRMGADIKIKNKKIKNKYEEPRGDLTVRSGTLKGTVIKSDEIPSLIDELPILMVAACFAKEKTIIDGIEELRVKETDRIYSMTNNLSKMGARLKNIKIKSKDKVKERLIIEGVQMLKGAVLNSFGDHRTAMSLAIAALAAEGESILYGIDSVRKSFPDFFDKLAKVVVR